MTEPRTILLEMSRLEAAHLADLVRQFEDLVDESIVRNDPSRATDPAIARLVPDAYLGDPEASREFRELTESSLLHRRSDDADIVLDTLGDDVDTARAATDPLAPHLVALDREQLGAWLRTLAALRLVLASRLGITDEGAHDDDDPRFGVYEWIGYRLDGLVQAAEG